MAVKVLTKPGLWPDETLMVHCAHCKLLILNMTGTILILNNWRINMTTGEIWPVAVAEHADAIDRIEPKAIQLLAILAAAPHQLVDKQYLLDTLWPRQALSEEPLTRCVSRLRKTLQDNPKQPQFIETLPRRGYRLISTHVQWLHPPEVLDPATTSSPQNVAATRLPAKPQPVTLVALVILIAVCMGFALWWLARPDTLLTANDPATALVEQADNYYLQMRRQDNEMAIELYQQAIALRPQSGLGLAGLANALVQQVIRWPLPASESSNTLKNLQQALAEERHQTTEGKQRLARALTLAQQAVKLAPEQPGSHKALGFVYAASAQFALAEQSYQRAIALDDNAWDALINMGDILEIQGQIPAALQYYEQAFAAMGRVYASQSARIQPWYADMGALIAEKHQQLTQLQQAESWYRHVLSFAPFNLRATRGLANLLSQAGDADAALRLCQEYRERIGHNPCQ